MFSQDVIAHLNLEHDAHERWFDNNEIIQELISTPHIIIQPTLMANIRRVHVSDTDCGRIIAIELYAHKWSYLLSINEEYADVDLFKDLMYEIDALEGRCRAEDDFLALELPSGYVLDIYFSEGLRCKVQKIDGVNLGEGLD